MKIDEYAAVRLTFENAFGFMLNRISDIYGIDIPMDDDKRSDAEDRCWTEFVCAMDDIGLKFNGDLDERG